MKKRVLTMVLALLMLLTLVACGNGSTTSQETPGQSQTQGTQTTSGNGGSSSTTKNDSKNESPAKPKRNDVIVQIVSESGTLDPMWIGTGCIREALFEPLWSAGYVTKDGVNQIGKMEMVYQLAESYEQIDEKNVIVHLRKGVTFSNGDPFTADDVLFTINLYKNSTRKQYVDNVDVDNTKIIDDNTIQIAFKSFNVEQMMRLSLAFIVNAETYNEDDAVLNPIGTGAYVVDEYVSGSYLKVKARDDYWGEKAGIENVTFKVISESAQITNAYETGEIDAISSLPETETDYIETLPNTNVMRVRLAGMDIIRFNMTENSPMSNRDARMAVIYAVDHEAINNIAYGGAAGIPETFLSTGCPDWHDSWVATSGDLYTGPNYDLAKEYAEKAGLVGQTLRYVTNGVQKYISIAEVIQSCLNKIGVNMEIINLDAGTFTEKCYDYTIWDLFTMNHENPSDLGIAMGTRILISNKTGWEGPEFDEMLALAKKAASTVDETERYQIFDEYMTRLQEYSPMYNVVDEVLPFAYNSNLQNVEIWRRKDYRVQDWVWGD